MLLLKGSRSVGVSETEDGFQCGVDGGQLEGTEASGQVAKADRVDGP